MRYLPSDLAIEKSTLPALLDAVPSLNVKEASPVAGTTPLNTDGASFEISSVIMNG